MRQDPGSAILAAKGVSALNKLPKDLSLLCGCNNHCRLFILVVDTAEECNIVGSRLPSNVFTMFLQDHTKARFCSHDQEIKSFMFIF